MSRVRKPANITHKDWDAVDSPPLSEEQLARLRPAREAFPDIDRFPKPRTLRKAVTREKKRAKA